MGLLRDSSGLAATEFAVVVPIMLVMFFGTAELSSGVAISRKVTLATRTLSDLTSQSAGSVDDNYLQNVFTASIGILHPFEYPSTPMSATLSEIYIDSNKIAKIQWSKAATVANHATKATLTTSTRNPGDIVTSVVPPGLLVKQTYLILSEMSYLYTPSVGYVMKSGVTLKDLSYTRPRQSICISYNNVPNGCPLS
jgi:Flp pilus assembly protein TadG